MSDEQQKNLCCSVILSLDTLLLFFFEAREQLNKNELVTGSDINENKHKAPTLQIISLVF